MCFLPPQVLRCEASVEHGQHPLIDVRANHRRANPDEWQALKPIAAKAKPLLP